MLDASNYWITIVELKSFTKEVNDLLSPDEKEGLIAYLANHPDEGAVIPETGGLRKLRWAARGKGKSGGARVIYYFRDLNMPLYLLTAFGKGEKIDLTKADKKLFRALVEQIVNEQWGNQVVARIGRYQDKGA